MLISERVRRSAAFCAEASAAGLTACADIGNDVVENAYVDVQRTARRFVLNGRQAQRGPLRCHDGWTSRELDDSRRFSGVGTASRGPSAGTALQSAA
jgi:hypothetical protein